MTVVAVVYNNFIQSQFLDSLVELIWLLSVVRSPFTSDFNFPCLFVTWSGMIKGTKIRRV